MALPQDPTNYESKHEKLKSAAIVGHTTQKNLQAMGSPVYCRHLVADCNG